MCFLVWHTTKNLFVVCFFPCIFLGGIRQTFSLPCARYSVHGNCAISGSECLATMRLKLSVDGVFLQKIASPTHLIGPTHNTALHRLSTSTTMTTTPFETDEAGQLMQVPLISQLRYTSLWTDEVMDDVDIIYTPLPAHSHGERESQDRR